jgi:acylglycerol lipase
MNETEYRWTTKDNFRLYAKSWEPDSPPRGIINLVHGLGEHINRYQLWSETFVNEGYAVLGFDHRGHGRSEGKRGDIPSFDFFMNDLDLLLQQAEIIFPQIPIILYGHSLGGNIVINYVLRDRKKPQCVIATSPWLRLALNLPEIKLKAGRIVKTIIPGFIQKNNINSKDLSHIPEVSGQYNEDPLVHNRISLRLFFESVNAGLWTIENADKLNMPLLLMHGSSDRITSHQASSEFAEKAKQFTTFKIWDGLYHELHHEIEKDKVFQFLINWIRIYMEEV